MNQYDLHVPDDLMDQNITICQLLQHKKVYTASVTYLSLRPLEKCVYEGGERQRNIHTYECVCVYIKLYLCVHIYIHTHTYF